MILDYYRRCRLRQREAGDDASLRYRKRYRWILSVGGGRMNSILKIFLVRFISHRDNIFVAILFF